MEFHAAQVGLELLILMIPFLKFWDYRYTAQCLASDVKLGGEERNQQYVVAHASSLNAQSGGKRITGSLKSVWNG